ncbi:hypothetical protein O6H91_06G031900 [Diphasiastrum complanatum]|uniref:Uncharacterized protein n=1 Tax=Diphasiastrum complanatum TaxID=34168 RepID=A0ACC2DC14_DIPCM|nr:hypothetical protein O6H91_06G031900 [Diphasiastrum complanatum]
MVFQQIYGYLIQVKKKNPTASLSTSFAPSVNHACYSHQGCKQKHSEQQEHNASVKQGLTDEDTYQINKKTRGSAYATGLDHHNIHAQFKCNILITDPKSFHGSSYSLWLSSNATTS